MFSVTAYPLFKRYSFEVSSTVTTPVTQERYLLVDVCWRVGWEEDANVFEILETEG